MLVCIAISKYEFVNELVIPSPDSGLMTSNEPSVCTPSRTRLGTIHVGLVDDIVGLGDRLGGLLEATECGHVKVH